MWVVDNNIHEFFKTTYLRLINSNLKYLSPLHLTQNLVIKLFDLKDFLYRP